jgi:hypothetical protein
VAAACAAPPTGTRSTANGRVARLKPTGEDDKVRVLAWHREKSGPFGVPTMTLDRALDYVASNPFFDGGCPGRCCKSEVGAAPPEPVGSGFHEEEQRREERYASIGFPDSPECSRDGGRRVGRGFRGSSKQL